MPACPIKSKNISRVFVRDMRHSKTRHVKNLKQQNMTGTDSHKDMANEVNADSAF